MAGEDAARAGSAGEARDAEATTAPDAGGAPACEPLGVDFRILFERSTDGILLAEVQTGRFLLANREIQRMLGYSEAELLQLTMADVHPAAELPHVFDKFQMRIS